MDRVGYVQASNIHANNIANGKSVGVFGKYSEEICGDTAFLGHLQAMIGRSQAMIGEFVEASDDSERAFDDFGAMLDRFQPTSGDFLPVMSGLRAMIGAFQ